jgi:hypothetical protein
VFAFGVYSSRINTAILGVTLYLLKTKPRCYVMKMRPYLLAFGYLSPAILVMIMLVVVKVETDPHGAKTDPNFQYGATQAYVALLVLLITFLSTIVSMILTQRASKSRPPAETSLQSPDDPSRYLLEDSINTEEAVVVVVDDLIEPIDQHTSTTEIEDLANISGSNGCSSADCRARSGAGRYRCDSEVNCNLYKIDFH